MPSSFVKGEVIESKALTQRLYTLKIRVNQLPFQAGQFIRLQLPVDGKPLAKPYSLINAPGEPDVEVLYNLVPDGQLTNQLASLLPGDTIEVSQPANGFFVLEEIPDTEELWMIATGSGIGPYIPILKSPDVWQRFSKIVLVHGVPLAEELVSSDYIKHWLSEYPQQFRYMGCVSREECLTGLTGLTGRITERVADGQLEERLGLKLSPEQSHVMLCGNREMITDMINLLQKRNMTKHHRNTPGQITTEHYF